MSDREMNAIHDLKSGLKDMLRSGRLTRADIPDDFEWLVKSLKELDSATAEADGEELEQDEESPSCPQVAAAAIES